MGEVGANGPTSVADMCWAGMDAEAQGRWALGKHLAQNQGKWTPCSPLPRKIATFQLRESIR